MLLNASQSSMGNFEFLSVHIMQYEIRNQYYTILFKYYKWLIYYVYIQYVFYVQHINNSIISWWPIVWWNHLCALCQYNIFLFFCIVHSTLMAILLRKLKIFSRKYVRYTQTKIQHIISVKILLIITCTNLYFIVR